MRASAFGQVERLAKVEKQKRAAPALVLAGEQIEKAVAIHTHEPVGGRRGAFPKTPLVPPRDDGRDVQVLRPQVQRDFRVHIIERKNPRADSRRTMNVRLAAPPAFAREVGDAAYGNAEFVITVRDDLEITLLRFVLRSALDFVVKFAGRQFELHLTIAHEVIGPER